MLHVDIVKPSCLSLNPQGGTMHGVRARDACMHETFQIRASRLRQYPHSTCSLQMEVGEMHVARPPPRFRKQAAMTAL